MSSSWILSSKVNSAKDNIRSHPPNPSAPPYPNQPSCPPDEKFLRNTTAASALALSCEKAAAARTPSATHVALSVARRVAAQSCCRQGRASQLLDESCAVACGGKEGEGRRRR